MIIGENFVKTSKLYSDSKLNFQPILPTMQTSINFKLLCVKNHNMKSTKEKLFSDLKLTRGGREVQKRAAGSINFSLNVVRYRATSR